MSTSIIIIINNNNSNNNGSNSLRARESDELIDPLGRVNHLATHPKGLTPSLRCPGSRKASTTARWVARWLIAPVVNYLATYPTHKE